jgi:dihydroflavonol-4-reductase
MMEGSDAGKQQGILITGATGLLGTHLILALHGQGKTPIAIYRDHIPDIIKDKAIWVKGDILDVEFLFDVMEQVAFVYHAAGYVSFHPKERRAMYAVNVEGTANVVNACLHAGVQKLLHVSSVAAMGRHRDGQLIDERMWWTSEYSNSEYSRSKYLGEMEVWRGIGEGLNAVVVNPTIIFGEYGSWDKGSMTIFKNIYNGFKWFSEGGSGFVDANDVARLMILMMESDIAAERFLVNAENRTYAELFFMIADAFGVPRPSRKVNPLIAAVVWRLEKLRCMITGGTPKVTRETARTSLALVNINNQKLLDAFPSFSYTPLKQSIERICKEIKPTSKLST